MTDFLFFFFFPVSKYLHLLPAVIDLHFHCKIVISLIWAKVWGGPLKVMSKMCAGGHNWNQTMCFSMSLFCRWPFCLQGLLAGVITPCLKGSPCNHSSLSFFSVWYRAHGAPSRACFCIQPALFSCRFCFWDILW